MKKENRSVDRYQQASRLRQARLQAGYATAAAFARAHGLGEADYRHKENANRGISVADAKAYASILAPKIGAHFTWSYILDGEKSSQATMMGYIGAGDQIFPFDDEHAWDSIAAPPDLKNPLAAIVHGDSMLPVYRDGDILFFGEITREIRLLINRDCVVQIDNDLRQIKCIKCGRRDGYYRLYSYATQTESADIKILWAAPVRWVKRK